MSGYNPLTVWRDYLSTIKPPICPLCGSSRQWVLSGEPETPAQREETRATLNARYEARLETLRQQGLEVY